MYHLTADQYNAFYLAVLNLLYAIYEGRETKTYESHVEACVAALTGYYPEQTTMQSVVAMAKTSDRSTESIESIIERLIGDFAYDKFQCWKNHSISKAEIEALGGTY